MLIPAVMYGTWIDFICAFSIWQIFCIVGVSGGLHRYYTHKSFVTNKFWEHVMLIASIPPTIGTPFGWVGTHRMHHAFSDTNKDPHSPTIIGMVRSQFHIWPEFNLDVNLVKDLIKNRSVVFVHRHYFKLLVLYIAVLYAIDPLVGIFFYSIPAVFAFHGTGLVNSVCHKYGYKTFDTKDTSRNNILVSVISPGEGWHNNHHHAPQNSNFSNKWWEIDTTYWFVKLIKTTKE
jgi:stearoyl-CoA desaturase (delta-9 desaturase)